MTFVNSSLRTALMAVLLAVSTAQVQAAARIAIFEFELIDTSLDGEMLGKNEAEQARLGRLGAQLREALTLKGYDIVDTRPVEDKAAAANLQSCGGCDATLARSVDATLSITGTVQKVSNLILNINLYIRDAQSAKPLAAMSVDIRSNSDESWTRGLSWLLCNRLFAQLQAIAP